MSDEDVFGRLERLQLELGTTTLEDEYRRWCAAPHNDSLKLLDQPRHDTFRSLMDTLLAKQRALASQPANVRYAAQLETEQAWGLFRHVLAQRADPHTGASLQYADACATAGYLALSAAGVPAAPPLVILETIDSPVTYPRNAKVTAPTVTPIDPQTFPIPLVMIPPSYLGCPWLLTTAHHEIGHALDRDYGVAGSLGPALAGALAQAGASPRARDLWRQWLGEIVADVFALLSSGPLFAWSLALIFDRLVQWRLWDEDDAHPPPALRMSLLLAMARRRHPGANLDFLAPLEARAAAVLATAPSKNLHSQVELVAEHALGAIGQDTTLDASSDLQMVAAMADWLRSTENAPRGDFVLRLVPAASQLALLAAADVRTIATRAQRLLVDVKGPAWVDSSVRWKAACDHVLATRPPILDEDSRRKVPPHELLVLHQQLAFVGASHDQLGASLERALAARGRKWQQIEVFFLAEPALGGISAGARGDVHSLQARALGELSRLLPTLAERWALYRYPSPFFFASFWDEDKPNGRIHVSPYIWGEDVATCPAVDYLRRDAEPTAQFAAYARGLTALRRQATRISSSHDDMVPV